MPSKRRPITGRLPAQNGDSGELPLDERIARLAEGLCAALRPIVMHAAGSAMRPSLLVRTLGVDATLAARIVRAAKSGTATDAIHEIPSPEGLRIFVSAAARLKLEPGVRETAIQRIREFELLLAEVPGGRAGLDAIASSWSPATRMRAEHAARQATFKSMSTLLGYFTDTAVMSVFVQPSDEDPALTDSLYLMGKLGLRRLRPGGRITVYGLQQIDPELYRTTVEGGLLSEFCSTPLPELQMVKRPGVELAVVPEDALPLGEEMTVVASQMVRRGGSRPRTPGATPAVEGLVLRMPAKELVFDTFVREDTYLVEPRLTATLHGFVPDNVDPDDPAFGLDAVGVTTKMERLSRGLEDVDCPEVPSYRSMVEEGFARSGWDRSRFVGYRCRMRYPVPLVRLTYWFSAPREGPNREGAR